MGDRILITVFYDGKCSLCSKEIAYYKKIAPIDTFIWCDITEDSKPLQERGATLEEGLMFLHVEDDHGNKHTKLDAFIIIWRKLPGWHYLAKLVSLPIIKQLVNLAYTLFARYRFKKNGYCEVDFNDKK